jgi:hypothetical protein
MKNTYVEVFSLAIVSLRVARPRTKSTFAKGLKILIQAFDLRRLRPFACCLFYPSEAAMCRTFR